MRADLTIRAPDVPSWRAVRDAVAFYTEEQINLKDPGITWLREPFEGSREVVGFRLRMSEGDARRSHEVLQKAGLTQKLHIDFKLVHPSDDAAHESRVNAHLYPAGDTSAREPKNSDRAAPSIRLAERTADRKRRRAKGAAGHEPSGHGPEAPAEASAPERSFAEELAAAGAGDVEGAVPGSASASGDSNGAGGSGL